MSLFRGKIEEPITVTRRTHPTDRAIPKMSQHISNWRKATEPN